MATQFFGINRGQQLKDVVTATSTNSTNVELAVNDAVNLKKTDVDNLTKILLEYIANQRATPFVQ